MSIKLGQLDSTSSDTFEVDIGSEITSPERAPIAEPPPSNIVEEGDDWSAFTNPTEDVEDQTSSEAPSNQSEAQVAEVSVDAFKKEHKFKLDPADEELRRTLRRGLKAPKFKEELDKVRAENQKLASDMASAKEASEVWSEIQGHLESGNIEKVMRAVVGDKFDSFLQEKLERQIEYMNADPLRRAEMEREDADQRTSLIQSQKDKRIKELEAREQEIQEKAQIDKYVGYATPALEKTKFQVDEVEDADLRNKLNKRLWKNAWDELEVHMKSGQPLSPKLIHQTFAQEAKILKAGIKKAVSAKVESVTAKQEKLATTTAAALATSNYPSNKTEEAASKWNGRSAKDLLKMFR